MKMHVNLGLKWLVGTTGSFLAALFAPGMDETLHEVAVILGILVSLLTVLNLAWSLTHKVLYSDEAREELESAKMALELEEIKNELKHKE